MIRAQLIRKCRSSALVSSALLLAAAFAVLPAPAARADIGADIAANIDSGLLQAALPRTPQPQTSPLRSLVDRLARLAPAANPQVIRLAVEATACAAASGMGQAERLAVIDYSLPSTEPRLWVFDLAEGRLIFEELVAHGKNTGDKTARKFSNKVNSLATSIGLFRTAGTYHGSNGYSLRMDGLDPGFNDRAKERAIVIHGAPYVSQDFISAHGRIGRSWGCPAVRTAIAKKLIDVLKDGQFVFSYYPDNDWLKSSPFLNCSAQSAALRGQNQSQSRPQKTQMVSGF